MSRRELFERDPLQPLSTSLARSTKGDKLELIESHSALYCLDVELIQYIASFLPTSSAAALALCSHHMKRIIGTKYWHQCNENGMKGARHMLLDLLSKDLRDHIHCHRCARMHKVEFPPRYQRDCTAADVRDGARWILFFELRFMHLQMAMKLHRQGENPNIYLDYLNRERLMFRDELGCRPPYITYKTSIVNNTALFQSQYCVRIPREYIDDTKKLDRHAKYGFRFFDVCGHLSLIDPRLMRAFICLCKHMAAKTAICRVCATKLRQCEFCGTEYLMDLKDHGKDGVVFVVTKWMDLGNGISSYDHKWTSLLEREPGYFRRERRIPGSGSIMRRFENCEPHEFEVVLSSAQEAALHLRSIQTTNPSLIPAAQQKEGDA